jgi:hypothetical protein
MGSSSKRRSRASRRAGAPRGARGPAGTRVPRQRSGAQVMSMSSGLLDHAESFLAQKRWRSRHQMRRLIGTVIETGRQQPGAVRQLQQLTGGPALVTVSRNAAVWTFEAHLVGPRDRLTGLSLAVEMPELRVVAVTVAEDVDSQQALDPVIYSYSEAERTVRVSWEFKRGRRCKIIAERTGQPRAPWHVWSSVQYQAGDSFRCPGELVVTIAGSDGSHPGPASLGAGWFRLGQPAEVLGPQIQAPLRAAFAQLAAGLPHSALIVHERHTPNARLPSRERAR